MYTYYANIVYMYYVVYTYAHDADADACRDDGSAAHSDIGFGVGFWGMAEVDRGENW